MATDEEDSSSQTSTKNNFFSYSIQHPHLKRTDAESIRVFLRKYDQYSTEIKEKARQHTVTNTLSVKPVEPVSLKFCVDPEYLESALALNRIPFVTDIDALTDQDLRAYLEKKAEPSKSCANLSFLDHIVEHELRMDMRDIGARSRIESLFISYHTLLRRHGLSWVLHSNEKIAVQHVLSSIKPKSLRLRIQSDLQLAHHNLKKDFKEFMDHCLTISDAFQLIDNGSQNIYHNQIGKRQNNKEARLRNKMLSGTEILTSKADAAGTDPRHSKTSQTHGQYNTHRPIPPCPHPICKSEGKLHWIDDCNQANEAEKEQMKKDLRLKKQRHR
ncbi:hypothetical protein BWQ96_03777 [Gracilariopsis chorda]|uniref:Uncharacterized protein n=1 Tax=Gracilariopsis chorda TaxID=448386 RepID=A0A2V3IWE1_9FLOR|nr:hypothetical protein BWQ96_03777 [Gracilariopsis chorda]|eukprot:PXF46452.1 hypothetical protein BWQ96_03777 [Gracilariopsis chorda]